MLAESIRAFLNSIVRREQELELEDLPSAVELFPYIHQFEKSVVVPDPFSNFFVHANKMCVLLSILVPPRCVLKLPIRRNSGWSTVLGDGFSRFVTSWPS